ncbi:unnamed protein product [Sphagnum jensenii]
MFVDLGRSFPSLQHGCEGLEKRWHYLLQAFLEEFPGNAIVCRRLAFGQGGGSVLDFFQREAPGQRCFHLLRDPDWDVSLTLFLGFGGARIMRI